MCFFNSLSVNATTLEARYNAAFPGSEDFTPVTRGNAFAGINWPVITGDNPGTIEMLGWGLIPSWVKDGDTAKKLRQQTLNARSETIFEKPSFRSSIKNKRCLIPSTGFYEWQHEGKKKIPWFIKMKEQEVFSMAGIWDEWVNTETGEIYRGFSILTTAANSIMERIHNTKKRMPVLLTVRNEKNWLSENGIKENLLPFFVPAPDEIMNPVAI